MIESGCMYDVGFNIYTYVGNDPTDKTDTSGNAFGWDDAIGFGLGAVIGAVVETVKYVAVTGSLPTLGQVSGAALTGGLVGLGLVNAPETAGVSFGAAVGGGAALAGNTLKQSIDVATGAQASYSPVSAVVDTTLGAFTGGVVPLAVGETAVAGISAGRNSFKAVGEAVGTKVANGTASRGSAASGAKAAVGTQTAEAGRTAVGAGADATKTSACEKGGAAC
jgi:hypothetical protein